MGYVPLFDTLTTGTLHGKWPDIGLWPVILSMADRFGNLDVTPQYISSVTGLPLPEVVACMERFCSPDEDSRTSTDDGRRLEPLDPARKWGWHVVNHGKYREKARMLAKNAEQTASGMDAARKREKRAVHRSPPASAEVRPSDGDGDIEHKPPLPPKGGPRGEGKGMQEALATPGLNTAAFQRWVEYRTEIRKPLKPTSLKAAAAELAKHAGQQSAVVQQSIANGWQGLFALKTQNGRLPQEPPKERRDPTEEEITEAQRKAREDNLRQLQRIGLAATKEVPR